MASYVLFGAGYIAYTTFIVAYLRNQLGFERWRRDAVLGLRRHRGDRRRTGVGASAGAAVRWTRRGVGECRGDDGRDPAGADRDAAGGVSHRLCCSAASFLIVPTSVTAFVRKAVPPRAWTAAIAVLTVGFAIGQCIGPWLSGVVSDAALRLAGGLLLSGGILAGAALIALLQREPTPMGRP